MKRTGLILATLTLVAAENVPVVLAPASGNTLELFVEKTGLLSGKKHRFVFDRYQGRVDLNQESPAQSKVTLEIQSASIRCTDTWVSAKDLKKVEKMAKEDMLAVAKYPVITFRSSAIRQTAPDQFDVSGTLTIRETTRPASVSVIRNGTAFRGHSVVRLTDFGLKPPGAALGLVGTKDEMRFEFTLTGAGS